MGTNNHPKIKVNFLNFKQHKYEDNKFISAAVHPTSFKKWQLLVLYCCIGFITTIFTEHKFFLFSHFQLTSDRQFLVSYFRWQRSVCVTSSFILSSSTVLFIIILILAPTTSITITVWSSVHFKYCSRNQKIFQVAKTRAWITKWSSSGER